MDTMALRQWAGEFDYPPPLRLRDEDELVALLDELAPGHSWEGDSVSGLYGDELAIYVERPTSAHCVAALLAYIWSGPMRGEWWDQAPVVVVPDHVYIFSVDTTKSQRDDVPDAWQQAKQILVEGTPVRTTDRMGPGTKGTRAVEGVGRVLLAWRSV